MDGKVHIAAHDFNWNRIPFCSSWNSILRPSAVKFWIIYAVMKHCYNGPFKRIMKLKWENRFWGTIDWLIRMILICGEKQLFLGGRITRFNVAYSFLTLWQINRSYFKNLSSVWREVQNLNFAFYIIAGSVGTTLKIYEHRYFINKSKLDFLNTYRIYKNKMSNISEMAS